MDRTILALLVAIGTQAMILSITACPQECFCSKTQAGCSRRQLQVIPEGIPESVLRLDLSENQITDVEAAKLSPLRSLEILSLQMNNLTQLKSLDFVNMTRVAKLYLANNKIETIDDNAFQGLLSLRDLDLANNRLSEINGKFRIARLHRLILSHNRITSLQDDTLDGVRSLHYLILSNNKISYISKSSLNGMTNLVYLALNGNPIKNIDNILNVLQVLSYLDISACYLTSIPKGLPWPLRHLKISENNLTMIQSQDLFSTRYLAHLIADNNQIQVIHDGALLYTPYMTEVNVSYNKIKWLPSIPKNIETFLADNNEIQQLSQLNFAHDSSMKTLSLRNNNISEIPQYTFSKLTNLNTLNLGHNGIKHLQNMCFAGARQLTALNLEFNPIEQIDNRAFVGLQKLEQLNLSNINSNETIIEGAIFQDVPSLASLYVQSSPSIINDILNRTDLLHFLQYIQHLDLTNGSLETVPTDLKHFFSNLKSIRLSDNPWHCDGGLIGLRNWIRDSPEIFADSSMACVSPDHLKGRAIQNVSIQELTMAAPTQPSYFWSHSLEVNLNITITFDEIMNQTETTSLGDVTQLFQPSSTVSIIQLIKPEDVHITSLLQAPDSTTNLEATTSPAYHGDNFINDHHQVLHLSVTSGYHGDNFINDHQVLRLSVTSGYYFQTHDTSRINSSLTSTARELNQQPHPSTDLSLMPGNATPVLQLLSLNAESSSVYKWPDNQMPANSLPHEVPFTSTLYTSADFPRKVPPFSSSPVISTTPITPQVTTTSLSTFTARLTSVSNDAPPSSSRTDATEDVYGDRRPHQTSTAETPPQGASSSLLASSMITTPTSQLAITATYAPIIKTPALNSVPTLALSTIIQSPAVLTQELTTTGTLTLAQIRTASLQAWPVSQEETLTSISVSEFMNEAFTGITPLTENTTVPELGHPVPDTTQPTDSTTKALLEEQNSTESNRHNKGDPVKPVQKSENRLPTFSSSGDIKLRIIIITVSTTLLALIVGLFTAVVTIRYRKKRKLVTFDDNTENNTDIQTETSDTVFIISHMQVQPTNNLNIDTSCDGKGSITSTKETPEAENSSKQTKKGFKFSRQSVSAVISKTKFNCLKGQKEDDSELLMYSWK